jgi:beta-lactamase class D
MQTLQHFIDETNVLLNTAYITVYQCDNLRNDIRNYISNIYEDYSLSAETKSRLKQLYQLSQAEQTSPKRKVWFFGSVKGSDYEQTKFFKKNLLAMKEEMTALLFSLRQPQSNAFHSYK